MRLRPLRVGLKRLGLGSLSLAFSGLVAGQALGEETGSRPWKPEPGKSAGWVRKANSLNHLAARVDPEVCFIGDSLTEFWNAQGSPVWQLEFQNTKAANLGLAADLGTHLTMRGYDVLMNLIREPLEEGAK